MAEFVKSSKEKNKLFMFQVCHSVVWLHHHGSSALWRTFPIIWSLFPLSTHRSPPHPATTYQCALAAWTSIQWKLNATITCTAQITKEREYSGTFHLLIQERLSLNNIYQSYLFIVCIFLSSHRIKVFFLANWFDGSKAGMRKLFCSLTPYQVFLFP